MTATTSGKEVVCTVDDHAGLVIVGIRHFQRRGGRNRTVRLFVVLQIFLQRRDQPLEVSGRGDDPAAHLGLQCLWLDKDEIDGVNSESVWLTTARFAYTPWAVSSSRWISSCISPGFLSFTYASLSVWGPRLRPAGEPLAAVAARQRPTHLAGPLSATGAVSHGAKWMRSRT